MKTAKIMAWILLVISVVRTDVYGAKLTEREFEALSLLIEIEDEALFMNHALHMALQFQPNEAGDIMVIMYHKIVPETAQNDMERSAADFRKDLATLYERGYRIISMKDYAHNRIKVEAGCTPVVVTFDDGWRSAFSLEEIDGELVPVKDCAVDILNRFAAEHPDFGKGGVFFINGYDAPFKGAGTVYERLRYLTESGYELGNHTFSHANLKHLSGEEIVKEIALLDEYVDEILPGYKIDAFAYPYGAIPQSEQPGLARNGNDNGYAFNYLAAFGAGPSGKASSPVHVDYDPFNIPRIRGTSNAEQDLGWYLDYYEKHPQRRYVSDGDPDTVTVPQINRQQVKLEALDNKRFICYGE